MTLKELLAAARKAINEGDLERADQLSKQAKAMKALDEMEPADPAPVTESDEYKSLKQKNEDLETFKANVEKEPANNKAGSVVVTEDETDKKAKQPWDDLGRFLKAVQIAALYPHQADARLKAQKAVPLGAGELIAADGGYLVQQDFAQSIFSVQHSGGEILSRLSPLPVGPNSNGTVINAVNETSRVEGSQWGGVQAYWASEGDSVTASKPTFRQMRLNLNKLFAVMYATDEVLEDTTLLGALVNRAVTSVLTWKAENSVLRGTGAGQPEGIIGHSSVVSVAKETGQAANTIVVENIFKMYARMWAASRSNAIWLINQDIEPQLWPLSITVGTGGMPVYVQPGGISGTPYATLMGRPVIAVEQASTLGTVGDIMLVDLSEYIMIEKGGINAAESMHVQFLTDQMTFRWTQRLDGQPAWSSAMTPSNGTNTLSPFVTLQTRA